MLLAHEASGRSLLADPEFLKLMRAYECEGGGEAPLRASTRDVTEGHWYALLLVPGSERKVLNRLVDEVWLPAYLPMRRELRFTWRGVPFNTCRALFTGYGFVLVADIDALFGRIIATEGVRGIMCESGEPAIVRQGADGASKGKLSPQRYDHDLIDFIRRVENGENADFTAAVNVMESRRARGQRKRPRSHSKRKRAKAA
jgi:Transcription termination factor nusG